MITGEHHNDTVAYNKAGIGVYLQNSIALLVFVVKIWLL